MWISHVRNSIFSTERFKTALWEEIGFLATEGKWTMTKLERRNDDVYDWVIVLTTILRSWLNPSLWHLHFCRNSTVVSRNACIIIFNAAAAVLCLYRREEHFVGIIIITGTLIPKKHTYCFIIFLLRIVLGFFMQKNSDLRCRVVRNCLKAFQPKTGFEILMNCCFIRVNDDWMRNTQEKKKTHEEKNWIRNTVWL